MMNETARAKMIRARSELVLDYPFFACLALRLDMREDSTCRSAWSDGRFIAYNPAYVDSLPLEKVKGVQCHEVLHLACRHHLRRGEREPGTWNRACDLAINHILLEAGLALPAGYLDDPEHRGKSAEAIYAAITGDDEDLRGGADGGPRTGETSDETTSENVGRDDRPESSGRAESAGEPSEEVSPETGDAAGSDGEGDNDDAGESNDPGMSGEIRDASPDSGGTDRDGALLREDQYWRAALAQAVNKSRQAGELPGGLERLISELLSPALHWRELLRRFVSDAAKNDFTWVRPNRRYIHAGLHLPGLENMELAEIAVAVDVSGSVSQFELDAFAAELSAVLEEFDATLTVIACDAEVTSLERLGRMDLPLAFAAKGGGGTDFRPPFRLLEREGVRPACMLYFTDMECSRFPEEPDFPVLWVTANRDFAAPPFGEVVLMEEDHEYGMEHYEKARQSSARP